MNRSSRAAFISAYLGWVFDYYEVFLLTFLVIPISTEFGLSTVEKSWLFSTQLLTLAVGGVLFGWLADRFGRRPVLVATICIYALGTFARAFAPDYTTMLLLTAIAGLGIGGEYGVGQSLVSELVPTRSRGFWSGLLFGGVFIGIMLGALVGGYVAPAIGWRWTFAVSGLPVLIAIYVRTMSPESSLWQNVARRPGAERRSRELLLSAAFVGPFVKCLLMATIYFFAYYGLATFLPSYLVSQGLTITKASWWLFFSGLAGLIGNLIGSYLLDRIGRRWTITAMMLVAISGAIPLALMWESLLHSTFILIPFFVLFFGANGPTGFGALFSEAFPTAVRTTGVSASIQIARGMSFIPPLIVPMVLAGWGYVPIVVASAFEFLVVCGLVWTFRETRNVDLQQIDSAAEVVTGDHVPAQTASEEARTLNAALR
jgi:MFS transporter, putative metabolite:H+ symporter